MGTKRCIAVLMLAVGMSPEVEGRRFFDDDPLLREPQPRRVEKAKRRKLNEYYDFFLNTFFKPGEEQPEKGPPVRARAVNTLGEAPDSAWYENRHVRKRMSIEELVCGPGNSHAPDMDHPWKVTAGKNEGITPGLRIEDSKGNRYLLKFDPPSNPEIASGADVIGSKLFYALGYHTPENYIVKFGRGQLKVSEKAKFVDASGEERPMTERDVTEALLKVPRDQEGRYRGVASYFLKGELIGPFRYHGVRTDDPNDIVPHEHRRDLRGLYVFAAWLNHSDSKSLNSEDSIVEEKGLRYIKHYLLDFGAILGSDSFEAKSPRAGNVYLFDLKPAAAQFFSLGLYVPAWMTARYPDMPAVGRVESRVFQPDKWKSNYPNPAFENSLPDDHFWAAKQVMNFSDEEIRALVETGEYSDPEVVDYITRTLIERRDKIGKTFFAKVLPLDGFRLRDGRLEFEDLAVKYNFESPRKYKLQWSRFDNEKETMTLLAGETDVAVPRALGNRPGENCLAAEIRGEKPEHSVTVYLRNKGGQVDVVGIDRKW